MYVLANTILFLNINYTTKGEKDEKQESRK